MRTVVMKRSSSSDGGSETNRLGTNSSSLNSKLKQTLSPQQQKQIKAQQELQQQQYEAQQQQQLQIQQQIQEFQQKQQQQQIQEYQQQQYAANQYYNQAAYYNYQAYASPQSSLMYNSGPSWNYISAPPPPLFGASPSPIPHPPLPPPELKLEKPPLPKEPEPGAGSSGSNGSKAQGGGKGKGLNGVNGGVKLNGGTPGTPGSNHRGRRKNAHFPPQMQPPSTALAQDLLKPGQFNDLSELLDEEIPANADKFTIFLNNSENGRIHVNKKSKRKPMSTRYTRSKLWVREEAEAALALEKEFNQMQKRPMLILKFPDPDLNKYIVKKYSPFIDTVHFQQPSTPRYCFVQLKEGADVEKVVSTIRQIPFGTGTISAEVKSQHLDDQPVTPEEIDPYTLYIGNLPTHISVRVVKQYFPNAQRIDIGYAQRMRYTRYAFIRYSTVEEAKESYRKTVNALLESRSLIVRFRRQKGNIGLPGEPKPKVLKLDVDEKETPTVEQNATETSDVAHPADELTQEDQSATKDDEVTRKVEKTTEEGQEVIEKVETVSQNKLSNQTVDAKATETTETPEETQASNTTDEHTADDQNAEEQSAGEETAGEQTTDEQTADEQTADTKVVTNPPVNNEKIVPIIGEQAVTNAETEKPTITSLNSPELPEDEGDNKQKVFDEASELIKRNNDRRALSPINFSAFAEPMDSTKGPVEGDIKLENSDDDDSSDDGGINLLGTRVKDEPFETPHRAPIDELYFDDYDYDDLCTDLDDDDDNWSNNSDSRSRQMLTTNWDIVRRSELSVREEKPDLSEIMSKCSDSLQSSIDVAPIKANLEPKLELDDLHPQPPQTAVDRERLAVKQELEDMFNRLNSDGECDDEDAFFGHT